MQLTRTNLWQNCGSLPANVAELVYATVLKTVSPQGVVGSTPTVRTISIGLKIPIESRPLVGELLNWLLSLPFSGSLFFCLHLSMNGIYAGLWQNLWQKSASIQPGYRLPKLWRNKQHG
jgi:hypothetical protein